MYSDRRGTKGPKDGATKGTKITKDTKTNMVGCALKDPGSDRALGMARAVAILVALALLTASISAQPRQLTPLDASGRITFFIDEGESGSGFRSSDRELATWAVKAWERAIDGKLRFEPASRDAALVHVLWAAADGSEFGEMRRLIVNGRPGAAVYIRPDVSALGPELSRLSREDPLVRETIVYMTCLHEIGHAIGLTHTANYRDIMYFFGYGGDIPNYFLRYRKQLQSRGDIAMVSGLSDTDIAAVRKLYVR